MLFLVTLTARRYHTDSEYLRHSQKSLSRCHYIPHKSHTYWPGIEPSPSWRNRLILTGSASSTGRWGDTDMEGRPSCPDGGTGQSALAPHTVCVPCLERTPSACKQLTTSNEVRTICTALTDSAVQYDTTQCVQANAAINC